jgi:hypothetical protein
MVAQQPPNLLGVGSSPTGHVVVYKSNEVIMNLTPNDKLKLEAALKDMATSMTRVAAERDLQKNVIGDICEELQLNKKVFRKLARVYYKQNFDDEVATHQEFETLYETVTQTTKP